jgi:predicted acetyltransferase
MTDRDPSYVIGLDELQCEELLPTFQWAFGENEPARVRRWFENAGMVNLRGYRQGGRLVGALVLVPMGQWYGGRAVPMTGVAGVAVAPEARGSGVAQAMMATCVRELHQGGTPVSALYPATLSLYRGAGYEVAGYRYRVRVPTTELPRAPREPAVREMNQRDEQAVVAAYSARAAHSSGWLDRGPYVWRRVRAPQEKPARGFVVEVDGVIEGYTYLLEHPTGGPDEYRVEASDLVATTERAARRLLAFLAAHRSIPDQLTWSGDPTDAVIGLLPDRRLCMDVPTAWMNRVLDVPAALEARGYASALQGELHLAIRDTLLPENAGSWVVTVADGRAQVTRGGRGELSLDIRGLSALYSGFRSGQALRTMGLADGPEEALATASALFAGPSPHMVDEF